MIFEHTLPQVLDRSKTQTRRLWRPEWDLRIDPKTGAKVIYAGDPSNELFPGRRLYEVGKTYAVQEKRGGSAIGRILLTDIAEEHVQDITEAGAIAEGFPAYDEYVTQPGESHLMMPSHTVSAVGHFRSVWTTIHSGRNRFAMNPAVAVLTFSLEAAS